MRVEGRRAAREFVEVSIGHAHEGRETQETATPQAVIPQVKFRPWPQALAISDGEIQLYGEAGCTINIGESVPLSCDHEQRVGRLLRTTCHLLLNSFATSLEEDEALLTSLPEEAGETADAAAGGIGAAEAASATRRRRQCLHSRISRKRCLSTCRERADAWVAQPTATASFRRPWRINIKTSG